MINRIVQLSAALLISSCTPELIKPDPVHEIEITSPLSFRGARATLYDTLRGPRGSAYVLTVRFLSNDHPNALNPTISFDGSGQGSNTIMKSDTELKLWYKPTTQGTHPIFLYWKNQNCGFYPSDMIYIQLNVNFTEQ